MLKSNTIKSICNPLEYPKDFTIYNNSYVFLWLFSKCTSGKIIDGKISLYENYSFEIEDIIEMRIFNETMEVYFRKVNNKLLGRERIDKESESKEQIYIDSDNILWGSKIETEGNFTICKEERGIELIIPKIFDKKDQPIFLTVRNYVEYNELGMAGFVDARFVKFYQN